MERWLPIFLFGLAFGSLLVGLAIYQSRRYHRYLNDHIAETSKMTTAQEQTRLAVVAQTAALERIATALEKRP